MQKKYKKKQMQKKYNNSKVRAIQNTKNCILLHKDSLELKVLANCNKFKSKASL